MHGCRCEVKNKQRNQRFSLAAMFRESSPELRRRDFVEDCTSLDSRVWLIFIGEYLAFTRASEERCWRKYSIRIRKFGAFPASNPPCEFARDISIDNPREPLSVRVTSLTSGWLRRGYWYEDPGSIDRLGNFCRERQDLLARIVHRIWWYSRKAGIVQPELDCTLEKTFYNTARCHRRQRRTI